MYVRDHGRPEFHKALGMTPTEYDRRVLRITSEICEQVFPVTLDKDNPAFWANLDKLRRVSEAMAEAGKQGGLGGKLKRLGLGAAAAAAFARLYTLPAKRKALPPRVRLAPSW